LKLYCKYSAAAFACLNEMLVPTQCIGVHVILVKLKSLLSPFESIVGMTLDKKWSYEYSIKMYAPNSRVRQLWMKKNFCILNAVNGCIVDSYMVEL
jgi:hypothetical protein